jgi:Zn-dependent M28 family amino/carboxypeptidase
MRPRRSVLFAGFSGEEMALLGSRHYVQEDPLFPLDRTAAMVNLDILGGGNGYMMVGALTFPQYYEFVAGINARYFGHEIRRRDNAPNSDHFYFGLAGVPAAFFYALEGPPVGIHSPTDVPEAMDPDFMAEAARLAFATAWYLANLEPEAAMRLRTTTP